jgi:hypothetical protein
MPVFHRNTRPFSFLPGAEDLSIHRQDSLQEREHAGEVYSNAYVAAVYNTPHEAQPAPIVSPVGHGVLDSTLNPSAVSQQQPQTLDAVYTPPELPDVLRIRTPVAHPVSTQRPLTHKTPLISPQTLPPALTTPSDEFEAVVISHAHRTLRRQELFESLPPQLPHAYQADPLQSQQHATDATVLHTFATTVYRESLLGSERLSAPVHGHQIARKPLPENANVPARFLEDAHPLARQGR